MTEGHESDFLVTVRAQVMTRDESTEGWLPLAGGGLANVSIRKRARLSPLAAGYEYIIYGQRISDQSVILSCVINRDLKYYKVMPTFHHWRAGKQRNGLTFQTAADARAFDKGILRAYNELIDGLAKSNPTIICPPLTKYDSVGEDDVFMTLDLPVESESLQKIHSSPEGSEKSHKSINERHNSKDLYSNTSDLGKATSVGAAAASATPTIHYISTADKSCIIPPPASPPTLVSTITTCAPGLGVITTGATGATTTTTTTTLPPPLPPLAIGKTSKTTTMTTTTATGATGTANAAAAGGGGLTMTATAAIGTGNNNNSNNASNASTTTTSIETPPTIAPSENYSYVTLTAAHHDYNYPVVDQPVGAQVLNARRESISALKKRNALEAAQAMAAAQTAATKIKPSVADILKKETRLRCRYCHELYNEDFNQRGACEYAPDTFRSGYECISGMGCARCMLYHCMSDAEGETPQHPCECVRETGCTKRWIGLAILSFLVPCLWCYPPLRACHWIGISCGVCGGQHKPQV